MNYLCPDLLWSFLTLVFRSVVEGKGQYLQWFAGTQILLHATCQDLVKKIVAKNNYVFLSK